MFVFTGLGFYVPMKIHDKTIDHFIEKQVDFWTERLSYWQKRAENDKNVILFKKYVIDMI